MEKKLKIVFYNNWHVGDIFFAQPFIKNVVDHNGGKFDYYFFCHYSDFIYTGIIPTIKNINYENEFSEIVKNIKNHNYNYENYVYLENQNILLINTWIASMNYHWNKKQSVLDNYKDYLKECDLISYIKAYEVTLSLIWQNLNIKIEYCSDIELSYPVLPDLNIDYFNDFKEKNKDRKLVFLNNYRPASGQRTSIQHSNEFIDLIDFLLKKESVVLLPENDNEVLNYKLNNNMVDLYFMLDEFPIEKNQISSSLYYCSKIGNECDISISFDVGRSFLYVNKTFMDEFKNGKNKNIKFHFGVNDFYFKNLIYNEFVPKNYATFINANNCQDIKNYLSSMI
jgi:hypothetical protein